MTKALARSTGLISLATLSSRVLGLIRDGVLSRFFGAGVEMDAFNIATRIPTLLRELFAEGAMSAAFVPTFTRTLSADGRARAWRLGSLVLNTLLVATGLIVVLGHTKCGAVTAVADGAQVHGHIAKLVDNIVPAVDAVKERDPEARGARLIRLSIRANVQQSMQDLLSKSETVATAVKSGSAQVVGGVYDLQSGAIEWPNGVDFCPDVVYSLATGKPIKSLEPA
mgnify:CR=1 FL=1